MSNIGKKLIKITEGVKIDVQVEKIVVAGPKGTLETKIPHGISVNIEGENIKVAQVNQARDFAKFYGLTRALVANMVEGVTTGFEKKLELSGVGYRARMEGQDLVLNLGFANPVQFKAPLGITLKVEDSLISVSGIDKGLVGDVASKIRAFRVPDPYKAKGIKYVGEKIRRKVGKAAKAVGAK